MDYYKSTSRLLCELDEKHRLLSQYRPFTGEGIRKIEKYYRLDSIYHSNAIEGFTYTRDETEYLILYGVTIKEKPAADASAVTEHLAAYKEMFRMLMSGEGITNIHQICRLHAFFEKSLSNNAVPGAIRSFDVFTLLTPGKRHNYPHFTELNTLVAKLFLWRREQASNLHPLEKAAIFHKKFEAIHPFGDANGRVGRLVLNLDLLREGFLPALIGRHEKQRYVSALREKSDDSIVRFIIERETVSLDKFLEFLYTNSLENNEEITQNQEGSPRP